MHNERKLSISRELRKLCSNDNFTALISWIQLLN